jgi:hypothetical protein
MISDKLKKFIFRKLYDDLSHVEIIPSVDSIWFIDRDKKYWYFEYEPEKGFLWWRDSFFEDFFILFSIEVNEFEPILSEWVEEVLNSNVIGTQRHYFSEVEKVEEVLTSNVIGNGNANRPRYSAVEEVLNWTVHLCANGVPKELPSVEEVLNCGDSTPTFVKVNSTRSLPDNYDTVVENVLNQKASNSKGGELKDESIVEVVLSSIT